MKKLIFNSLILAVFLFACDSVSVNKNYQYSDFSNTSYVSGDIIKGRKPSVDFSSINDLIEIRDFPDVENQTGKYQILVPDESPSGKWTITKEYKIYFVIKSQREIVYRYYEGDSEKSFILKLSK